MDTQFYTRMAQTASRLIKLKGAPVILKRYTGGIINPVTGEKTPIIQDDKNCFGILADYQQNYIDGKTILQGDKLLIIDSSVKPLKTDKPMMNYESLGVILNIKDIKPAGMSVVYFLQVRS